MAAKEQLTAMEMIWGFMSGTTGHMGKTDFAPQKEAFGDFASPETYFPRVTPESEGISSEKLTQMLRELAAARGIDVPLTDKVYEILYEGHPASEAVSDLMERPAKTERG